MVEARTIQCEVCDRRRPVDKITSTPVDISAGFDLPTGHAVRMRRHCNDSPPCILEANGGSSSKQGNVITIHPGRAVICDSCSRDYTNSDESGGMYFGGKAICTRCDPEWRKSATNHDELHLVEAVCPADKSFADWVREDLR